MAFAIVTVSSHLISVCRANALNSRLSALKTSSPSKRRRNVRVVRACAGSSPPLVENATDAVVEPVPGGPPDDGPDSDPFPQKWRLAAIGVLYAAFTVHNIRFGPGSLTDSGALGQILSGKTDEVNDLLIAVFYGLGVIGGVYGGLLAPGAGKQDRLSTALFSTAGCVLGFFAVGPYLAARVYAPSVSSEELGAQGWVNKLFESKLFAWSTLGMAMYVYVTGLGLLAPAEMRDIIFYSCWQDTARLFASDRGVHATVLDGAVLSMLMWGPLTEDMRRRGWVFDKNNISSFVNAILILAAPCLGPALYLVLRPSLPSNSKAP
jgi:hypothetical protein